MSGDLTTPDSADLFQFPCKVCGAKLSFKPGAEKLLCEYCGNVEEIPRSRDAVVEHAFEAYMPDATNSGYGRELKRYACQQCGAQTEVEPHISSFSCAFCGSNQVLPQEQSTTLHKPESLLPFLVDQKQCLDAFRAWVKSLWFRPNALKAQARPEQLKGVYIPFWTYDSMTQSWWNGEAGYYYYESESYLENGEWKTRRVRKIRWEWRDGTHAEFFDDVPVQGSPSVDASLVRAIEPFDTKQLVPYKPDYLSGLAAEDYREDMIACWPRAKDRIDSAIYSACKQKLGGDEQRNLSVTTSYLNRTYKLCLLPIWIASYRYQEKPYTYIVNGQTGKVAGKAPWSWLKITLFVVTIIAILAGIAMLAGRH